MFVCEGVCVWAGVCVCVWRGEGERTDTKTVCQTAPVEVNTEIQLSTQCRACGKINIWKSKNSNFDLSTK